MKKIIIASALLPCLLAIATASNAQELAKDQNPNYQVSRAKYMGLADSVNRLHSTTLQETYKAYDWYEAKQERKQLREQFRRELRMERARSRNFYYPGPYYNQGFYNQSPYHHRYYQRHSPRNFWWWF